MVVAFKFASVLETSLSHKGVLAYCPKRSVVCVRGRGVALFSSRCPQYPYKHRDNSVAEQQDFPGKNTGVGCHSFPQGSFPTRGRLRLSSSPALTGRLFTSEPPGTPFTLTPQPLKTGCTGLPHRPATVCTALYHLQTPQWTLPTNL